MKLTYVTSGAVLQCPFGTSPSKLEIIATPPFVKVCNNPIANINNNIGTVNIQSFCACNSLINPATAALTAANGGALMPAPCTPVITSPWLGAKNNVIARGAPALLVTSKCMCSHGGVITITHDGQIPVDIKKSNYSDLVLDRVQEGLDVLGFIPVLGAIPDVVNVGIHLAREKYVLAGLSLVAAVPGIGDFAAAINWATKGVKGFRNCIKMVELEKKVQEAYHLYKKYINKAGDINSVLLTFDPDIAKGANEIQELITGEEINPKPIPTAVPGHVSVGISVPTPIQDKTFDDEQKSLGDKLLDFGSKWFHNIVPANPFTLQRQADLMEQSYRLFEESLNISESVSHDVPPSSEIEKRYMKMN